MNKTEHVTSAIEAVTSNPKFAASVATGTVALGGATKLGFLNEVMATISMAIGIITAIVVCGTQLIRFEQAWRERRRNMKKED